MFYPYASPMYGWGLGGGFMMIVFWVLIVLLVVWAVREFSGKSAASSNSSALDILQERYAKGEIDKKEFEEKKKDLIS